MELDAVVGLPERLRAKVVVDDGGCWLWCGAVSHNGYGRVRDRQGQAGRTVRAHRLFYELLVGPILDGLTIDHLCRVRRCVNPAHLEPTTMAENLMRSPVAAASVNAAKDECINGHAYTPENTGRDASCHRFCRQCHREQALASYHRTRA